MTDRKVLDYDIAVAHVAVSPEHMIRVSDDTILITEGVYCKVDAKNVLSYSPDSVEVTDSLRASQRKLEKILLNRDDMLDLFLGSSIIDYRKVKISPQDLIVTVFNFWANKEIKYVKIQDGSTLPLGDFVEGVLRLSEKNNKMAPKMALLVDGDGSIKACIADSSDYIDSGKSKATRPPSVDENGNLDNFFEEN